MSRKETKKEENEPKMLETAKILDKVLEDILEVWKPKDAISLKERKVLCLFNPYGKVPEEGGVGEFYLIPSPASDFIAPEFECGDFFEDQRMLVKMVNSGYGDKDEIKKNMNEVMGKSKYFCFRIIGREIQTWASSSDLATTIYRNFESEKGIGGTIIGDTPATRRAQSMWITREELMKRLKLAKKREHHVFNYFPELNI